MDLLIPEIIRSKRDGNALSPAEIRRFIEGVTSEEVTDAQIAAFSMAAFFKDLNMEERTELTKSMRDSGEVLHWGAFGLNGPVLDKHSTGGIGDAVSLMLAPILAACGGFVPMIAGRGLAHTGGTIDKLESIPGYSTQPTVRHFQQVVASTGMAIAGQTADLAPADRRMYATRDVTATVEQYGLITASILSKKLAAGLEHLVMDIKVGNGAFMKRLGLGACFGPFALHCGNGCRHANGGLANQHESALGPCRWQRIGSDGSGAVPSRRCRF